MLNSLLKIKIVINYFGLIGTIFLHSSWAFAVDFESIYQSALIKSTELSIVRAEAEAASALYKSSNSNFLPRAGIESRYEAFESDFEKVRGGTANAFVEWNIFNGFKDIQNRKSLLAEAKAVGLEKERVELNFRWIAMARYTKAQVAQENVEIYKKVIDSNLKNLETVRIRRSSGRLSDADFIEFELFDSKLRQDLIELETEAAVALAELQAFSGMSPITTLSTKLQPKQLDLESLSFRELFATGRSKLVESQLKVEAAEARKSLATGSFLPEVNIKATHGSLGLRETTVSPETSFGITAKWELFSGLESVNARRVASAQLVMANAELENSKIQYLSRADQLKNQLKSILTRLDFEQRNQKNIDKFLITVQDEYRRGVKNSNDLKSALELVLETQLDRAALRADYFAARSELQELLGIEITEK